MLPELTETLTYWAEVSELGTFPVICKLVKALFAIPHGNADVERLFSSMNNVKTQLRNQLGENTVKSLLIIKLNRLKDQSCYEFTPSNTMLVAAKSATYKHHQEQANSKLQAAAATTISATAAVVDSQPSTSNKRARKAPKSHDEYMCM